MGLNLGNPVSSIRNLFSISEGETLIKKGISKTLEPGTDLILLPLENDVRSWTLGETRDTSITPFAVAGIVPTEAELIDNLEYRGVLFSVSILNESGANDDYTITLSNFTTSTTIATITNFTINKTNGQTFTWVLDENDVKPGEAVQYRITNGVLGTAAGRTRLGGVVMDMKLIGEITGKLIEVSSSTTILGQT